MQRRTAQQLDPAFVQQASDKALTQALGIVFASMQQITLNITSEEIAAVLRQQPIEPTPANIMQVVEVLREQAQGYTRHVLSQENWEDFLEE